MSVMVKSKSAKDITDQPPQAKTLNRGQHMLSMDSQLVRECAREVGGSVGGLHGWIVQWPPRSIHVPMYVALLIRSCVMHFVFPACSVCTQSQRLCAYMDLFLFSMRGGVALYCLWCVCICVQCTCVHTYTWTQCQCRGERGC